jgi:hypothetical protein
MSRMQHVSIVDVFQMAPPLKFWTPNYIIEFLISVLVIRTFAESGNHEILYRALVVHGAVEVIALHAFIRVKTVGCVHVRDVYVTSCCQNNISVMYWELLE